MLIFLLRADFGRTLPEQDLLEKQVSHPRKESARKALSHLRQK